MSFTPRNVSQLLVAKAAVAIDALADVGDYTLIEIPVIPAPAAGGIKNKGVRITVKTATGVKVSDFIPQNAVVKSNTIAVGVEKAVTATFAAPTDFINKTFRVTIDMHDHIGSMLNDRFISAYVACDADGNFIDSSGASVVATLATVVAELIVVMAATLAKTGGEFTVTADGTDGVTITEIPEQHIVGVKDGIHNPWELQAGYIDSEILGGSYNAVAATYTTVAGVPSDLVQLKNVEWFNSGYDKDPYRQAGFPYSFQADNNVTAGAIAVGDDYSIFQFYKDRDATNIERQHKQLIVVGDGAAAVAAALTSVTV